MVQTIASFNKQRFNGNNYVNVCYIRDASDNKQVQFNLKNGKDEIKSRSVLYYISNGRTLSIKFLTLLPNYLIKYYR